MWDAISNAPFVALLALMVRILGDSPWILRLLPAVAGTASVFVLYQLQRRFFSIQTALLGTLIFAIHPFAVAFSRVLFADPLQVFFVILGWLAIDRYMMAAHSRRLRWDLAIVAIVWAVAFLMKYNAIVPGGLWILAGWIGGRYRLRSCAIASFAVLLGPAITLLLWPYDAPFWFLAYLRQGAHYDLGNAATYYVVKLRLIFFGLTPLVTAVALVIRFRRPSDHTKATALFAIFSLAYLITVILLGRTFERYLIVVVPALSMVVAGVTQWLWTTYRTSTAKTERSLIAAGLVVIAGAISIGMTIEYIRYTEYLENSIDVREVARTVENLRTGDERAYWYAAEPIAGYYLGFTRYYSRPLLPDSAAAGEFNYFEGSATSHAQDRTPYHVLEVRQFSRRFGLGRILRHPVSFVKMVQSLANRPIAQQPAMDYITMSRPGDLLIIQSGMPDLQGEPLLERIDSTSLPPMFARLPLETFNVEAVFRPEGRSTSADTTITKFRAGMWILRKK